MSGEMTIIEETSSSGCLRISNRSRPPRLPSSSETAGIAISSRSFQLPSCSGFQELRFLLDTRDFQAVLNFKDCGFFSIFTIGKVFWTCRNFEFFFLCPGLETLSSSSRQSLWCVQFASFFVSSRFTRLSISEVVRAIINLLPCERAFVFFSTSQGFLERLGSFLTLQTLDFMI